MRDIYSEQVLLFGLSMSGPSKWVGRGEMRALRPDHFGFDVPICLLRDEHTQHSLATKHVYKTILDQYESNA